MKPWRRDTADFARHFPIHIFKTTTLKQCALAALLMGDCSSNVGSNRGLLAPIAPFLPTIISRKFVFEHPMVPRAVG